MINSIKNRLMLSFTAIFIIIGTIASALTFYASYQDSHHLQDDLLRQISRYVSPRSALQNERNIANSRDDARISVYALNRATSEIMFRIPRGYRDGFYTLIRKGDVYEISLSEKHNSFFFKNPGNLYRAYVRMIPQGQIVVMQENAYREELAKRTAWASLFPIVTLLPLILLLTFFILKYTMKPVDTLSKEIAQRKQHDLTPLPMNKIPTEVKGFIAKINDLLVRTNQFVQQQKRFIADASHELRSPMTALSLQVERLANQSRLLPNEIRLQVNNIQQGIHRSRDLLEQLLSLARVQNNNKADFTMVSIPKIFGKVIADLYPLAEQKAQDIGVVSENEVLFKANETDLYLLTKTLVDNAIRYTPEGSQIDLSVEDKGDEVWLSVEDNGKGIPHEERKRVLDPFYRILGSEQQGAGLGLAIANSIVQNYGGKLILQDSEKFRHGLKVLVKLNKLPI